MLCLFAGSLAFAWRGGSSNGIQTSSMLASAVCSALTKIRRLLKAATRFNGWVYSGDGAIFGFLVLSVLFLREFLCESWYGLCMYVD